MLNIIIIRLLLVLVLGTDDNFVNLILLCLKIIIYFEGPTGTFMSKFSLTFILMSICRLQHFCIFRDQLPIIFINFIDGVKQGFFFLPNFYFKKHIHPIPESLALKDIPNIYQVFIKCFEKVLIFIF